MHAIADELGRLALGVVGALLVAQVAQGDALLFMFSAGVGAVAMFGYDRWRRRRRGKG